MLPAEVQRIVLLIGLAATGYLLILAWNDDYIKNAEQISYTSAPEVVGAADVPDAALGAVGEDTNGLDNGGTTESDVPDASLVATPQEDTVSAAGASSTTASSRVNRLVKVSTPTLQIWIDRLGGDIVRVHLPKFPVAKDQPDTPYQLMEKSGGNTYIAQSGLAGTANIDSGGSRPLYETTSSSYSITGEEDVLDLVLTANKNDLVIKKHFRFTGNEYLVQVDYEVDNQSSASVQASLFGQIKRSTHEPAGAGGFSMGPQPYLGAAYTTAETRYKKVDFEDIEDDGNVVETVTGGWIAFLQHYFLSAWVAQPQDTNKFYAQKRNDGTFTFGFTGPLKTISAGSTGKWQMQFYAGPKDQKRLEKIAPNLNLTVDYGFLWWLAVPLFYILDWLHGFVGNWGFAIILLTVCVKAVLWPVSAAGYRSMAKMRKVGPQMKRLQERYADDRQKLSTEMMALYKKEGANPLGGCLPMLLPMPIFLALYWVLFESVELRQAPFMLWIQDLAAMDPFFILPLLMGGSMYLTQLMTPMMGDPMQVRMMRLMPIMFTVLFLFFPAGLVLYWLVNSLLSVGQQWWVNRQSDMASSSKS